MVAVINAVVEINVNTATDEELKLIEAAKASLHSYEPLEYKKQLWLIESISLERIMPNITTCKIYILGTGKKKRVNFHVEVNKDLMPSQEQLDAGGGEGSKRFVEMYIKAASKK